MRFFLSKSFGRDGNLLYISLSKGNRRNNLSDLSVGGELDILNEKES